MCRVGRQRGMEERRAWWRGSIVCWLVVAEEAGGVGGVKPEVRWTTAYAAALQPVLLIGKVHEEKFPKMRNGFGELFEGRGLIWEDVHTARTQFSLGREANTGRRQEKEGRQI